MKAKENVLGVASAALVDGADCSGAVVVVIVFSGVVCGRRIEARLSGARACVMMV